MKAQQNDAPMTLAEVKKLKSIKAKKAEKTKPNDAEFTKGPEMEMEDGRYYPKGTKSIAVKVEKGADKPKETDHFYPAHADFEYKPAGEAASKRKPKFIDRDTFMAEKGAKTIFGPDNRVVFNSTAYPWRCVGRVETPLGFGSGVMIGPRHVLTCSHIIDWKPNNQTGWFKFTPMYYNGSSVYGSAWGVKTYWQYKVAGPTIDGTEAQYDYTVIVLDRTIGNQTGWLGSKTYSNSWDNNAYWTHAGYPADITGTQRPVYQTGIALDGQGSEAHEAMWHRGDIWPGQSGGPFWAYWGGAPYAVATQSWQNASQNGASGGSDLVNLVIRARNENP